MKINLTQDLYQGKVDYFRVDVWLQQNRTQCHVMGTSGGSVYKQSRISYKGIYHFNHCHENILSTQYSDIFRVWPYSLFYSNVKYKY